jgi:hypothetical protein
MQRLGKYRLNPFFEEGFRGWISFIVYWQHVSCGKKLSIAAGDSTV